MKYTVAEIREKIAYNPETGELTLLKARRKTQIGQVLKAIDVSGYIQVCLARQMLKGHRIAWAIHFGEWPSGPIDHINGVRDDNRITNLREVDHKTNCQNIRHGSVVNKSTGFLGVYRGKSKSNPFIAKIVEGGKRVHLGVFKTPEEAHAAYVAAKRKLHAGCTI